MKTLSELSENDQLRYWKLYEEENIQMLNRLDYKVEEGDKEEMLNLVISFESIMED